MDQNRDTVPLRKSFQQLSEEFHYDCETFWNKVPKACVLIEDQRDVVTATKDLMAGLFLKESFRKIISLALDLAFFAKCSPSDHRFLYEKVSRFVTRVEECQPDEVLVQFKFRGWYDEWIKYSPKTDMEKEFFDFLSQSENNPTICFFGPWLAAILLKFGGKPSPSEVTIKIVKFFCRENPSVWRKEFSEEWTRLLKGLPKVQPYQPKKDALYRTMIETAIVLKNKRAYELMYFTTLQSIQFTDMMLVKMITWFRQERPSLKLYQIEKATRTSRTAYSWDAYSNFLTFFHGGLSIDEQNYAKYARAFHSKAFSNLTYANNPILCNYLAIIADYGRKGECSSGSHSMPTFLKLISNRNKVEPMTYDDFEFCWNAAEDLRIMESNALKLVNEVKDNRTSS